MPDISMCDTRICPVRARCYRHMAKPNEWRQSWFSPPPDPGKDGCGDFMALRADGDPARLRELPT